MPQIAGYTRQSFNRSEFRFNLKIFFYMSYIFNRFKNIGLKTINKKINNFNFCKCIDTFYLEKLKSIYMIRFFRRLKIDVKNELMTIKTIFFKLHN